MYGVWDDILTPFHPRLCNPCYLIQNSHKKSKTIINQERKTQTYPSSHFLVRLDDRDVALDLQNIYSVLVCLTGHRLSRAPSDPPAAWCSHARSTPQPSVSPVKEGASSSNSASGERGKVPSRERLAWSPGKEEIPGKRGVSNIFGGVSRPFLFSCPLRLRSFLSRLFIVY